MAQCGGLPIDNSRHLLFKSITRYIQYILGVVTLIRTKPKPRQLCLLLLNYEIEKIKKMSQPDKKTLTETNIEEAYNRHLAIATTVKEQYDTALMGICADIR